MSRKALVCILVAVCLAGPQACKSKKEEAEASVGQEWYRYISAYTSGTVFRKSDIRVLFVNNAGETGEAVSGLLDFTPPIAGRAEWKSPRELVFTPERDLKPGQDYRAVLNVKRILKLPKAFDRFTFGFSVVKQEMEIRVLGLFAEDAARPHLPALRGELDTSDREEPALVEKVLEAEQAGVKLPVEWSHAMGSLSHYFTVKGVERGEQASAIRLTWDGAPLGIKNQGVREVEVPALSQFELVDAQAVSGEARYVQLRFSDALARDQNLRGLIRIGDRPLTFEIDGNLIRAYSSQELVGVITVNIEPGIRNYLNRRLARGETRQLTFATLRPQARFVGAGVILPRKDRLTVPIEAVNLKSLQVTALQVYPDNMAQFFQVNPLDGSAELTRVGRYLWRKTVALSDDPAATRRWSRYDLDVTPLFRENAGSLFRIVLTFNRGNSTYPCPESDAPVVPEPPLKNQDEPGYDRYSGWDYADYSFQYNHGDWLQRNNPCNDAYFNPIYNRDLFAARNFVSSSVGLVAKIEENGTLHVVTTDIGTARPLSGARVRAYNFQNQLLAESVSDGNGFAVLKLSDKPFYVSVEAGDDIGYLRVNSDAALPLSHFDVGGETVRRGIKGVIYGERGVWRPGDTLYLTFALFDRERVLPPDHPVVLELYSPQGQRAGTFKPDKSVVPFHAFRIPTDESAQTGNWEARVLVGGLTFTRTLKIETVVPNRLKIDFQAGRKVLTKADMPLEVSIAGQWLHGAPAANLKFDVTVKLFPRPTRFDRFADYAFDDPASAFTGGEVVAEKGLLDADGKGRLKLDFQPKQASAGMLEALFTTRIFEESGDFSIDTFSLPFHPYDSYAGLKAPKGDSARGMLLTDTDQTVDIVTLDPSGQPVSRGKINVALYKIDWRWWWDRSGESLAQYVTSATTRPILTGEISTRDGLGRWTFQVKYPDWGRYLLRVVDPESGHAAGRIVYIDWPGWAGRAREEAGAGATRLNFTSDKDRYKVGETAVVFLPETVQGRALVSVENGSSVLQKMWVSTAQGENRFEIPLTAKMTPNVYVHVTLLQPHTGKVSDTPIRLYGVIPIMVDDPATRLEPSIQTPDEIKPAEKFRVRVTEKSGRPMTYTLTVVDEGLLGLTRFSTPDLRAAFYSREALGVRTWDLFDQVVEAYGAELSRIVALGGGEGGPGRGEDRKPRRFPPVVLFEGPFELKAGEIGSHELDMPEYFGAVRVMVVAGRDGSFGSAEKSVPVRSDLMALATLPRIVRPGEDVAMPVAVFVTNPALKEATVGIETNAMFKVAGEASKTVAFARPGDDIVTFMLKTADAVGQGEVRFRASSGSAKAGGAIAISVLGSNPMITQTRRLEAGPGQAIKEVVTPFGLENTNAVTVEASPLPALNLEKRLEFLIRYPHGCLEQTLSAAFPQFYLDGLVRLEESQKKDVALHIEAAIDKMTRFQMTNGAFSYWPGGHEGHEWTTAYAGWFLLEASRLGYHVPPAMVDSWKANQRMLANNWTTGPAASQLTQAFRLYCLALARTPDLGAMNRLREAESLDGLAAVQLAAAFHVTGQTDAAADLADRARPDLKPYRDDSITFGSDFRDEALLVRSYVQLGREDKAKPVLDKIAKILGSDLWLSTHETSFGLMALTAYYGTAGVKPFGLRLGWDGETPQAVESKVPLFAKTYDPFPARGRTLVVENTGKTPLYVSLHLRGMPPAGGEPESANDLAIEVRYRDMQRNPIPIETLTQGTDFMAEVRVRNVTKRTLNNLVLTHLVAAGCQIKNPRFTGEAGLAPVYDYQDIRDDRVFTYFGLGPESERTFLVVLNASYQGRFYQPGIAVEAMYEASVHANTKGQWVEIVR